MFEIYLALVREAKILEQSTDSAGASSISLQLAFEKWVGETDFIRLLQGTLSGIKRLLTEDTAEHTEMAKYIADPYEMKLSKGALYRWLKVLKMPSSR